MTTTIFQKARLLKLADLLETDAKNKKGMRFDLGTVGQASVPDSAAFAPALDCGTTACAMGLAAVSGAFKRSAGLSFTIRFGDQIRCTINGRQRDYDDAAMKIFGITRDDAYFLFSPSDYEVTPRGAAGERFVAKRIRAFVKARA